MKLPAIFILIPCLAFGMGGGKKPSSDEQRFHARRSEEIKRQAPKCGIPVEAALKVKASVRFCQESGRNGDGSWVCGDCPATGSDCVHGWFRGSNGAKSVEYLFALPDLRDGTIAHEVHHELMVVWYGIGGHPARSTVTRLDNGQRLTIRHGEVIGWRWPSLVNWALPEQYEIETSWGSIKCAYEQFEGGGGI